MDMQLPASSFFVTWLLMSMAFKYLIACSARSTLCSRLLNLIWIYLPSPRYQHSMPWPPDLWKALFYLSHWLVFSAFGAASIATPPTVYIPTLSNCGKISHACSPLPFGFRLFLISPGAPSLFRPSISGRVRGQRRLRHD